MKKTIKLSQLMPLLGNFDYVENAPSRNGMNKAPNQFILYYDNGVVFQSYYSLIGVKVNGQLYLTDNHDYSVTTSRFCGLWCGKNTSERREGLENGTITLIEKD